MKRKCLSMDQVGKADALYIVLPFYRPFRVNNSGNIEQRREEPLLAFYWAGYSWKGNQIATNGTGSHVS